jgi:opacity protein-like surface antigen
MKTIFGAMVLLAIASMPTLAQDSTPAFEAGGGYTFRSFNVPESPRFNSNGWNATVDGNFNRWLGLAADFDGTYGTNTGIDIHQYTFMFGPRIYPMGHHRLTPFVHALFGVSRFDFGSSSGIPSDSDFGFSIGGGVDYTVTPMIAIRVGEVDYERTDNLGGNPDQNNVKVKVGVLFRFGQK